MIRDICSDVEVTRKNINNSDKHLEWNIVLGRVYSVVTQKGVFAQDDKQQNNTHLIRNYGF